MMIDKSLFLLILLTASAPRLLALQAPDLTTVSHDSVNEDSVGQRDDRWRLMLGILFYSPDRNENVGPFVLNYPGFVNFHYRWSNVDPSQETIQFGSTQEFGLNILLNTSFPFPWFYYRFGTEMRFFGAGYVDLHGGLTLIGVSGAHTGSVIPFPFIGLSSGYIVPILDRYAIEVESGLNALTLPMSPLYPYITIGVVLR